MNTQKLIIIFILYNIIVNMSTDIYFKAPTYSSTEMTTTDFQTEYTQSMIKHGNQTRTTMSKTFDTQLAQAADQNDQPDRLNIWDLGSILWNTATNIMPIWIVTMPLSVMTTDDTLGENETERLLYYVIGTTIYLFGIIMIILIALEMYFVLWAKQR